MNETGAKSVRKPRGGWLRFSLRTLLVTMGVLGVGLGYLGNLWRRIDQQRRIVLKIEAAGGAVLYDYELNVQEVLNRSLEFEMSNERSELPDGRPLRTRQLLTGEEFVEIETISGPKFLRRILGDKAFANVVLVGLPSRLTADLTPQDLRQLPHLKIIRLHGAQMNDEWLAEIARLPQLRLLALFSDQRGSTSPAGIAHLQAAKQLESLSINGKWVDDEIVAEVAKLKQLKSLQIALAPQVTLHVYSDLGELAELQVLEFLQVRNISDQGSEQLSRLHNLRKFSLTDAPISDSLLAQLSKLKKLEWVYLPRSNIGDGGMESLSRLPNLRYLDLERSNVSDAGLKTLVNTPQLQHLSLNGTNVTDAGMPALGRLKNLRFLSLRETAVNDNGLTHLRTLENLKLFCVGPHVTLDASYKLQQALPDCRVRSY